MKPKILYVLAWPVILLASTATGAPPEDPVGPVKPVEVVNLPLPVEGDVTVSGEGMRMPLSRRFLLHKENPATRAGSRSDFRACFSF